MDDSLEITPEALAARLRCGDPLVLIDVREPFEYDVCRIEGANLVPLAELAGRLEEIRNAGAIVCYCHRGVRSMEAASWLRGQGVSNAMSLAGGIDRWSREVDPRVPRY